jgi:hypothetical protein
MPDPFDEFQRCLAEYESQWDSRAGLNLLGQAHEIYLDVEDQDKTLFDNLIKRYGAFLEKSCHTIFNSLDAERDEYLKLEFQKIVYKEYVLFKEFQSIEMDFGKPIKKLLLLLIRGQIDIWNGAGIMDINERRIFIQNLAENNLEGCFEAISFLWD